MEMKSAGDCWIEAEQNLQKIDPKKMCTFGIPVLDDAMMGILPNDLIVVGGDSGVGKSEIGLNIALHNAANGKKIGLYFIEGNYEEAINRIRWKMIKDAYFKRGLRGMDMDYRKWRMNMLKSKELDDLNAQCYVEFQDKVKDNLYIYSFEEGFTIEMLTNSLGWFSKQRPGEFLMESYLDVDLLIIDHLQYFTLANPKNELTEMTQILMKVKDITNFYKIPVILISHLRKKEKDRGLPSQEDFFGTSNIAKICSQAIVLYPFYKEDNFMAGTYPTFFRFVKSRTGLRSSIAALCNFNVQKGKYEEAYEIYKLNGDLPFDKPMLNHEKPSWAYKRSGDV